MLSMTQMKTLNFPKKIYKHKHLCLPINISNKHWIMLEILIEQKKIIIKDSLGNKNEDIIDIILLFFFCENKNIDEDWKLNLAKSVNFKESLEKWGELTQFQNFKKSWKVQYRFSSTNYPQKDSHSCGLYTCLFGVETLFDTDIEFKDINIDEFRDRMKKQILNADL